MGSDLKERLVFHGRYATETQMETVRRKNEEREEAAARITELEAALAASNAERDISLKALSRLERAHAATGKAREAAETEAARLRDDAERWRAFFGSERFYVMGWAGFTGGDDPQVEPGHDPSKNWLHFTLNVWDRHPAGTDMQGTHGRKLLLAYVEHLRARAALGGEHG